MAAHATAVVPSAVAHTRETLDSLLHFRELVPHVAKRSTLKAPTSKAEVVTYKPAAAVEAAAEASAVRMACASASSLPDISVDRGVKLCAASWEAEEASSTSHSGSSAGCICPPKVDYQLPLFLSAAVPLC
jgi:hypothetical protein